MTASGPRQQEKLKQEIIKIFAENGLKITCDVNLTSVNFLDVNLNLETGTYKPFIKPGDKPTYVNASSNHPPAILKNIPMGINKRLCEISSSKEVFDLAAPLYQAELDRCGYSHRLEYFDQEIGPPQKRKNRSKRISWFNPPYSINVETNIGKNFLELLDKNFPRDHVLRSVMNRNCIKISYRCLPNMGSILAKHNSKILRQAASNPPHPPPKCNCQKSIKDNCPVSGACNQAGAVYQTTVNSDAGRTVKTYVGLAKDFKKRYYKHKKSITEPTEKNSTTLSTHFLKQQAAGKEPQMTWKFLETNLPTYNPVRNSCRLCLREKYIIVLKPHLATLNSRSEIFSACRHKRFELLITRPPDDNSQGG